MFIVIETVQRERESYLDYIFILDFRAIDNSFVEVESLTAYTTYKFLLSQCSPTKTLYNEFNIQTEHDSKFEKIAAFAIW